MKIVYLCEKNCSIHKSLDTLIVKKGGYKLDTIPLIDVGTIIVFGHTQLSEQAFSLLFEKGIDLVFVSYTGKTKGRVYAEKISNVVLRIAQYEKWRDKGEKLTVSKAFVSGKIQNQIVLLEKYYRYTGNILIKEKISDIKSTLERLEHATDINTLMGIEGICARNYFDCFSQILKRFVFEGRERRPAYDPVNSLLNFGYAFLRNEIISRLSMHSFDIELGFLHGIRYGRASLALDLMEEFRPLFIDEFVITLFNKGIFKDTDFEKNPEGCVLKTESLKKFCRMYQEHSNKADDKNDTWKDIMDRQVAGFRQYILEGRHYTAFRRTKTKMIKETTED